LNYSASIKPDKHRGLKADPHGANGGIGVTYSNVMLGGVNLIADSGQPVPHSTYRNAFVRNGSIDDAKRGTKLDPDQPTNQTHKSRFISPPIMPFSGESSPQNKIAYVKGVDFNS
jgi:hypothetical protein